MSSHRRGPWSQGEDAYLVQLVHTQGALNWVRIAQLIGSRSPKQCRERYHQNLKPSLNHEPISPEEGLQIERLVAEMGKRWAEIARRLHGRSDNAVKNWWNGSMNRRRRVVVRRRAPSGGSTEIEEHQEPAFAHPADTVRRPLKLGGDYSSFRYMDPALPSPSVSEASRADSLDGAPSLVSDSGSTFSSFSPRASASPSLELPPLAAFPPRRPSLPMLQLSPQPYPADADRYHGDVTKHVSSSGPQTPLFLRREHYPGSELRNRQVHFESGQHEPIAAAPSVQLPPLRLAQSPARDMRMNLSSLLG